jgi:transposase
VKILYRCVCGMDVHKKVIVACVRRLGETGRVFTEVRKFATMTANLEALRDWLKAEGVTHVAMESTGVFWKPVYNILEGHFEQVMVVNAQHIKKVPGRKTDVTDSEWIAQLLHCGLLNASFVPDRPLRELRDLTRSRTKLTREQAAVANRIHKVLEDANIKLGAVASDILGASGRSMIEAIVAGQEDPGELAELARRRLRGKIPELRVALKGRVTDHHRFQLKMLLEQYDFVGRQIEELGQRISAVSPPLFKQGVELLVTSLPGAQQRTAEGVMAEIGTNMGQFPSAKNLASWAGVCPGNHESAGKSKSGKTRKGNRWLRGALGQMAFAASRSKGTYFRAQYHHIAAKRGRNRALVAVQHSLLTAIYHMLRDNVPYRELGEDFFERRNAGALTRYHVGRLECLGHKVTLTSEEEAA